MRKYIIILTGIITILISGCALQPKKSIKADTSRELTMKEINSLILTKMPIRQKVGDNSIKIVSAEVERDGKTEDGVIVNSDFIYTSFAIPEGIAGRVTLKGTLLHNKEDNNLYLHGLQAIDYTFADKKLATYVTDKDKKLIEQMVAGELSLIPVYHISDKIKNVDINKNKISLTYGNL